MHYTDSLLPATDAGISVCPNSRSDSECSCESGEPAGRPPRAHCTAVWPALLCPQPAHSKQHRSFKLFLLLLLFLPFLSLFSDIFFARISLIRSKNTWQREGREKRMRRGDALSSYGTKSKCPLIHSFIQTVPPVVQAGLNWLCTAGHEFRSSPISQGWVL